LYDVEYINPQDGRVSILPFGHHNLQATSEANLIGLAEHHEALANEYRELAKQSRTEGSRTQAAADKKE